MDSRCLLDALSLHRICLSYTRRLEACSRIVTGNKLVCGGDEDNGKVWTNLEIRQMSKAIEVNTTKLQSLENI